MPVHKVRIARFINKDPDDRSTAVHDAALSAKSKWHEPPGIYELPGAVVPTWAKIGAHIDADGLEHVDIHKEPVAPREKGGREVKRARKDEVSAQLPCFGWASREECRFEQKGDPCKYRHDPTDKSREQNESGGVFRQWGRTQETQGWCSHDTERFCVGRRRRKRKKWKLF